jgi:hypothetical protein
MGFESVVCGIPLGHAFVVKKDRLRLHLQRASSGKVLVFNEKTQEIDFCFKILFEKQNRFVFVLCSA